MKGSNAVKRPARPHLLAHMKRYMRFHRDQPARELYVLHTDREKLDVTERQWLGIRSGGLLPLDPGDWLDPADRDALHRALSASQEDVDLGGLVEADEVLEELRAT